MKEYFRLLVFFLLSGLIIYWNSPVIIFLYILLLVICLPLSIFRQVGKKYYFISFAIFIIGVSIYGLLARYIDAIELWGDEIGVIAIAQGRFQDIVHNTSHLHAVVPPLDYWTMWFWNHIVEFFPVQYMEFIYRVPYMMFHIIGAILFTFACIGKSKQNDTPNRFWSTSRWITAAVVFFTYFFNPILFFYSIEVRFYSLMITGVSLILLLYRYGELDQLRYFPLLLLFCLNSIYQLIVLPFFLITCFSQKYQKRNVVLMLCGLIFLAIVIWPILLTPLPISNIESLELIKTAIYQSYNIQFWSFFQKIFISIVVFALVSRSYKDQHLRWILFVLTCGFAIITGTSYVKGYFDFHIRHYLFLAPLFLYAIFYWIQNIRYKLRFWILLSVVFFMTVPWVYADLYMLTSKKLFSKAFIGSKDVMQYSESNRRTIIVLPNINKRISEVGYIFSLNSIRWYARSYGSVKVIYPETKEKACEIFSRDRNTILYSLLDTVPCEAVVLPVYGALLGLH